MPRSLAQILAVEITDLFLCHFTRYIHVLQRTYATQPAVCSASHPHFQQGG